MRTTGGEMKRPDIDMRTTGDEEIRHRYENDRRRRDEETRYENDRRN